MPETPLLPCPFCGAPPVVGIVGDMNCLTCFDCHCVVTGGDSGQVALRWNRRAPMLSPDEQEALEWAIDTAERVLHCEDRAATLRALLARTEAKP